MLVLTNLDKVGAEAKGSKRDNENELVHVRFVAAVECLVQAREIRRVDHSHLSRPSMTLFTLVVVICFILIQKHLLGARTTSQPTAC